MNIPFNLRALSLFLYVKVYDHDDTPTEQEILNWIFEFNRMSDEEVLEFLVKADMFYQVKNFAGMDFQHLL